MNHQVNRMIAEIESYMDQHRRVISGKLAELQLLIDPPSVPVRTSAPSELTLVQPRAADDLDREILRLFEPDPSLPVHTWLTARDVCEALNASSQILKQIYAGAVERGLTRRVSTRLANLSGVKSRRCSNANVDRYSLRRRT